MFNTKVISTRIDEFKRRVVKILRFGLSDVQESQVVAPWGVDSNPIKDAIAAFSDTSEKGAPVVLGYINKSKMPEEGTAQHAAVGELRLYSTNAAGEQVIYIWLKNDGTIELGGNSRHAVRYEELEDGFNALRSDHNDLVQKWNSFCIAYVPGSAPPSLLTETVDPSTADISGAKINKIKTL